MKNPTIPNSNTEILSQNMVSGLGALSYLVLLQRQHMQLIPLLNKLLVLDLLLVCCSWDKTTGVLKYYQPTGLASSESGFKIIPFTSSPEPGYGVTINCNSIVGPALSIDTAFQGITTSINNKIYQLGLDFVLGIGSAEFNKKSGELIYIDNRFQS